jgi:hypothetical protein
VIIDRRSLIVVAFLALPLLSPNQTAAVTANPSYRAASDAHRRALNRYGKYKDAVGAVAILEEMGVKALLTHQPKNMPGDQYLSLLNDYGFFLSKTETRYVEAVAILKAVLEFDPDREVAYLNLGDTYTKLFMNGKHLDSELAATNAYHKYYEIIKREGKKVLLPSRVVDAVYGSKDKGVCQLLSHLISSDRLMEWDRFFNPERPVGWYSYYNDQTIFAKFDISKEHLSENFLRTDWNISKFERDVDGSEDLRFMRIDGSAGNQVNYFLRKNQQGIFVPMETVNNESVISGEGGRLIGWGIRAFRYAGKNYLILQGSYWSSEEPSFTAYTTANGELRNVCTVELSFRNPDAKTNCSERICGIIRAKAVDLINEIASSEIIHGIEKRVEDQDLLKPFVKESIDGWSYYDVSPQGSYFGPAYSIDIDNDGVEEVFFKQRSTGGGFLVKYAFLKRKNGRYVVMNPGEISALDEPKNYFYPEEDFIFERAEGKNYLITVKRRDKRGSERKEYNISIYLMEKGNTYSIGSVSVRYNRQIKISQ